MKNRDRMGLIRAGVGRLISIVLEQKKKGANDKEVMWSYNPVRQGYCQKEKNEKR